MSDSFPAAQPHGRLDEVFPDVFVVQGAFRLMPGWHIPRNMTVFRQEGELTLLNSVRLSPEGEAAIEALGTPKHLVRLGGFHGADDPYLRSRWSMTSWAPKGVDADRVLGDDAPVGTAHVFAASREPEAAMLLPGEILVTCDSFQNWTPTTMAACPIPGRWGMKALGFGPELIGPMWLKKAGRGVEADFRRIAELPFRHSISGHGEPLRDDASAAFGRAIARTFA